ncbi:MAG: hypothetical protein DWQ01_08790 [Planctomycetota bacterium]|nr:MAG: hypothetical protein DWQ01_08790 [Planctomycetota bacterium]
MTAFHSFLVGLVVVGSLAFSPPAEAQVQSQAQLRTWLKTLHHPRKPAEQRWLAAQKLRIDPQVQLQAFYELAHPKREPKEAEVLLRADLCLQACLLEPVPAIRHALLYYADRCHHRRTLEILMAWAKGQALWPLGESQSLPVPEVDPAFIRHRACEALGLLFPRCFGRDRRRINEALLEAAEQAEWHFQRISALDALQRTFASYRESDRNARLEQLWQASREFGDAHLLQHAVWFLRDSQGPILAGGINFMRRLCQNDPIEIRRQVEAALSEEEAFFEFSGSDVLKEAYGKGPRPRMELEIQENGQPGFRKTVQAALQAIADADPALAYMLNSAPVLHIQPAPATEKRLSWATFPDGGNQAVISLAFDPQLREHPHIYIPVLMHEVQHVHSRLMGLRSFRGHRVEEDPFRTEFLCDALLRKWQFGGIESFHGWRDSKKSSEAARFDAFLKRMAARGHWKDFEPPALQSND